MKLFVTDPCLVVPDSQWSDFCDATDGDSLDKPFNIDGGGRVVDLQHTANGDGGCRVRGKEFGTDTGLIAIIEVADDFKPEHNVGAFAKELNDAKELMAAVCAAL